jgi:hypothetical protein
VVEVVHAFGGAVRAGRARYYDPNLGRFTQPDTINHLGDLQQGNPYEYAGGDPINYADPRGTCFNLALGLVSFGTCDDGNYFGIGVSRGGAFGVTFTGDNSGVDEEPPHGLNVNCGLIPLAGGGFQIHFNWTSPPDFSSYVGGGAGGGCDIGWTFS